MSWYISLVGKPSSISRVLKEESDNLTGQSKLEYDTALPHLESLVKENFYAEREEPLVLLQASGSGYARGEEQVNRTLSVKIEPFNTKIV